MTCQSCPGLNEPAAPPERKFMPSMNQIAGVPSSCCQRMSDLPSPLKSPVPLTCQLGPGLNGPTAPTVRLHAVHQPDRWRPIAVLPQDVGLAVAVEVAGALDLPARPRIERADGTHGHGFMPSISQIAGVPSLLPQDVGLAVAVEVAGVLDLPARPRIERADGTHGHGVDAVHQPDRRRAVAALPQDVGLAVAVEVAGVLDLPARPRIERAGGTEVTRVACRPSARSPACHRCSATGCRTCRRR